MESIWIRTYLFKSINISLVPIVREAVPGGAEAIKAAAQVTGLPASSVIL